MVGGACVGGARLVGGASLVGANRIGRAALVGGASRVRAGGVASLVARAGNGAESDVEARARGLHGGGCAATEAGGGAA